MTLEKVCEVFAQMADISLDQSKQNEKIITLAIDEVKSKIRPGISQQENEELLTHLCAAHAYYRYVLTEYSNKQTGSFSAGSVSVNTEYSKNIELAKKLRDEYLSSASFLINDTGSFTFCQIGG